MIRNALKRRVKRPSKGGGVLSSLIIPEIKKNKNPLKTRGNWAIKVTLS